MVDLALYNTIALKEDTTISSFSNTINQAQTNLCEMVLRITLQVR